jgi:hypothetical protein
MNVSQKLSVNRVAAVIYDALQAEVIVAKGQCSNEAHQGCLTQMDIIWECRSTEQHDVFRRVAEKVLAEVRKERPEVVRKLRVVTHDG